jgi:hypothetical protein
MNPLNFKLVLEDDNFEAQFGIQKKKVKNREFIYF